MNLGVRRIRPLYQQIHIPPLVDPTHADPLGSEAHKSPSPPKEPAIPPVIELLYDLEDYILKKEKMEPKLELKSKIIITSMDYSDDEDEGVELSKVEVKEKKK